MNKYNRKRAKMITHARTPFYMKSKKGLTETRIRLKEKKYLYLTRLTFMFCYLPTELQRKLSKMLKFTGIIMILYYVTPMISHYNGFYLFPLSRAVNSNLLIFDPSGVKIHQYSTSRAARGFELNDDFRIE